VCKSESANKVFQVRVFDFSANLLCETLKILILYLFGKLDFAQFTS
jgi:hypothetical protein